MSIAPEQRTNTNDDGRGSNNTNDDGIPAADNPNDAAVIAYIQHLEKLFPQPVEPLFEDGVDQTAFGEFC